MGLTPITGTNWIAVAHIPADTVYRHAHRKFALNAAAAFSLIALLMIAIIRLSREIGRPLTQLGDVARRIADNDNDARAKVTGTQELRLVATQFNQMLDQRIAAEQMLKRSEQRWNFALEGSGHAVLDWNLITNECYFSPLWKAMLGYAEAEIGTSHDELDQRIHPDDKLPSKARVDAHLRGETPRYEYEGRLRHKDGSYHWIMARGMLVERTDDGAPLRMIGTHTDITRHKLQERAIALTAQRSQAMLELPHMAEKLDEREFMQHGIEVAESLTQSRIAFLHFVHADEDAIELVTWSRGTLAHYCHAGHETHYPIAKAGIWADAARQRKPVMFNDYAAYPHKRGLPEGHAELHRLISTPVIDDGRVCMLMGVGNKDSDYTETDIETTRLLANQIYSLVCFKRASQELRFSEQRWKFALEGAGHGVSDRNLITNECYYSPAWKAMLGYGEADIGSSFDDSLALIHDDDRAPGLDRLETYLRGGSEHYENKWRLRHKDGTYRWILERGLIVERTADGKPLRMVCTGTDVTNQFNSEVELRRLNWSLQALGRSNAALVHAANEESLLQACCEGIAGDDGYPLAWVGLSEANAGKSVRIVAQAGRAAAYLDGLRVSWADAPDGQGPAGSAIRSGKTQIYSSFDDNPADAAWKDRAQAHGIASSIALPLRAEGEIIGVVCVYSRKSDSFGADEIKLFEEFVEGIGFGLNARIASRQRDKATEAYRLSTLKLKVALESTIESIGLALEARDPYTAGHERRVAQLAAAIAGEMGLGTELIESIRIGATVHDLGKLSLPQELLSKPTRLSAIEFELIKQHCNQGFEILKGIEFPWPVAQIALQHHERMDGNGYPNGLKGKDILLEARVVAVADVVEAMSSHRPYRPSLGLETALAEITLHRGSHYDPDAVDACLRLFKEKGFVFTS